MASGENIYIHGDRAGDPKKVTPEKFQAGDRRTGSILWFGHDREFKEFHCFRCVFALLNHLNGGLLQRGISFLPRLQESITGDLPGACCHRPPLLPLLPTQIQSHFLWFLCLGLIGVSSLVLTGRPVQSGHLGKWFLWGGINNERVLDYSLMRHQKPPVSSPGLSSRRFEPQLPKKAKAVLPSKRPWGPAQTLHGSPRPSDAWPDGHTCASLHARLPARVKRSGRGLAWRARPARGSVPRSLSQGRCEPGEQPPPRPRPNTHTP